MNPSWRKFIWILVVSFVGGIVATGCATRSKVRLKEHNAFLAGQNAALRQQLATQASGITIVGAVQNPQVPWIAGLTLAQAIATANYIGAAEPKKIIITRNGESSALDSKVLFDVTVVPLEIGDVIELR